MSSICISNESIAFRLAVVIGSGLIAGFSIYQANAWGRVRASKPSKVIMNEANLLYAINILVAIFSLILFFWGLYRLFFNEKSRAMHYSKIKKKALRSSNFGWNDDDIDSDYSTVLIGSRPMRYEAYAPNAYESIVLPNQ